MRTVGGMRAWHVDPMRTWVPWLRRVAQVWLVVLEADHVRVRWIPWVRVLVVLRHQRHRHVADRARVRLHVGHLAHHLRHARHLSETVDAVLEEKLLEAGRRMGQGLICLSHLLCALLLVRPQEQRVLLDRQVGRVQRVGVRLTVASVVICITLSAGNVITIKEPGPLGLGEKRRLYRKVDG